MMFRRPLAILSLSAAVASASEYQPPTDPECTEADCCHSCKYGYCAGNTHHPPSGYAFEAQSQWTTWGYGDEEPCGTAYTCDDIENKVGDFWCGMTGYKPKSNMVDIPGDTKEVCCDFKTCADLDCGAWTLKAKADPIHPSPGDDPDHEECCEDIVNMCMGNTDSNDDYACPAGYKSKAELDTISYGEGQDTDEDGEPDGATDAEKTSACCEPKTCADYYCAGDTMAQTIPDDPPVTDFAADGKDPTKNDCCSVIEFQCRGNTNGGDVSCPTGYKDLTDYAGKSYADGATDDEKTSACCAAKTCADYNCADDNMAQEIPDDAPVTDFATDGKNPTKSDCCTEIVDKCYGNTQASNDVTCPADLTLNQGTYNANAEDTDDDKALTKSKLSSCCSQPKCQVSVAAKDAVPSSCNLAGLQSKVMCKQEYDVKDFWTEAVSGSSAILSTCEEKSWEFWSDKSNIAQLPADPDDWAKDGLAGIEVTAEACCNPRELYCKDNTPGYEPKVAGGDVTCPAGYKSKDNLRDIKISYADAENPEKDDETTSCCEPMTCTDYNCADDNMAQSIPDDAPVTDFAADGKNPTKSDCCTEIVGKCQGNTQASNDVTCPGGNTWDPLYAQGFILKEDATYNTEADDLEIEKYSKCCEVPQCIKNVEYEAPSCESKGVASVSGTCNPSTHTEAFSNIVVDDWKETTEAVDVSQFSNSAECCMEIEGRCSGNFNSANDVICPGGSAGNPGGNYIFNYEGQYNAAVVDDPDTADVDEEDQEKWAKCCEQPACIKNVAEVAGTCEGDWVDGTAGVSGTCSLWMNYYEDFNMPSTSSLLAAGADGKDVSAGSNIDECCKPRTLMCSSNADSKEDYACPAGYKSKTGSDTISYGEGQDTDEDGEPDGATDDEKTSACCEPKTCADYYCAGDTMAQEIPDEPPVTDFAADGKDPTKSDCCSVIEFQCQGNTNGGDVSCPAGYNYLTDYTGKSYADGATSDEKIAACCAPKTCADYSCADDRMAQSIPDDAPVTDFAEAGKDPTKSDCCTEITSRCTGNTDPMEDVTCPATYEANPAKSDTSYTLPAQPEDMNDEDYEKTLADPAKFKTCCQQPKCHTYVAPVPATCEEAGVAERMGSCNPLYFDDKSGIESLPSDPSDWLNPPDAISVYDHSNPEECCVHKPRCISDKQAGVPFACPDCKWALDYHVNPVGTEKKCANDDFPSEWTYSAKDGPICKQKVTPAPTPVSAEALAAEIEALDAEIEALETAIADKKKEIEAMEDGPEKEQALKELAEMEEELEALKIQRKNLQDQQAALLANATSSGTGASSKAKTWAPIAPPALYLFIGILSFLATCRC